MASVSHVEIEIKQLIREKVKAANQQKRNTRQNEWAGKVIHWESRKRLKFDHLDKRYMHKTDPSKGSPNTS